MQAGKLNRRVTLQRARAEDSDLNGDKPAWSPIATVWASKRDVSDAERLRSAEVAATISTRFEIRLSRLVADLSAKDRLICRGTIYEIVGVKENDDGDGLEISAMRRGDA